MAAGGAALDRVRALVRADQLGRATEPVPHGYLNFVETEPEPEQRSQRLMVGSVVPAIYERLWRPLLGRVLMGVTGPGMSDEKRIARLLLGLSGGEKVMDLACGPGNFSREFARAVGPEGLVVGVDVSRPMLERGVAEAREAGVENLVFTRGDAAALPFEDASFDAVCCFGALYLFNDPLAALDEMTRVLRDGGRIALMTSVRRGVTPGPVKPLLEAVVGVRIFEQKQILEALEDRGYTEVHQRLAGLAQFVGARLGGG